MEKSEKDKYFRLLQDSLSEVEGYLKSSEDAAAAVSPDKRFGQVVSDGGNAGSATSHGNEKKKEKATSGNKISTIKTGDG